MNTITIDSGIYQFVANYAEYQIKSQKFYFIPIMPLITPRPRRINNRTLCQQGLSITIRMGALGASTIAHRA